MLIRSKKSLIGLLTTSFFGEAGKDALSHLCLVLKFYFVAISTFILEAVQCLHIKHALDLDHILTLI